MNVSKLVAGNFFMSSIELLTYYYQLWDLNNGFILMHSNIAISTAKTACIRFRAINLLVDIVITWSL